MEHIEEAGIHSGDSACSLPPYSLSRRLRDEVGEIATRLARALEVRGLMNLQLAIQGDVVYVLEVNPRASRTVPFVAKAIGLPIAKIAARVMAGEPLAGFALRPPALAHIAVKEAVFPFARFPGVDLLLGPEMKSTGEVMGLDRDFGAAFAKSQLAAGNDLPSRGAVFLSVRDRDKLGLVAIARDLAELGYTLVATRGTAAALAEAGLPVTPVRKAHEGGQTIVELIRAGEIALMINTTEGRKAIQDSYSLRRAALTARVPYYTTMAGARAVVQALRRLAADDLEVNPLQSYVIEA
jgi:carbamoyl-phosphate synthase large subunit